MSQSPDAAVALVKRFVLEIQQDGKFDIFPEVVHKDFVNYTSPPGADASYNGALQLMQHLHVALKDIKIEIVHCVSDGNVVATNKVLSGIYVGEFFGKQPTGKRMEVRIMDFISVVDGKLRDHWSNQGDIEEAGSK